MKKLGFYLFLCSLLCGEGCVRNGLEMNGAEKTGRSVYCAKADVRYAMRKIDRSFEIALAQLVGDNSPGGRAGRKAFMERYCFWKFSGVGDLRQISESSTLLSAKPLFFENKWEGCFAPDRKGLLPGIFGEPQNLQTSGFPLPGKETLLCGAAVIRFRHLSEAMQAHLPKELCSKRISSLFTLLAKVPETRLFFELRGHTSRPKQPRRRPRTRLCWELRTADPAPELFSALSQWAVESGCGIVEDHKVYFGTAPKNWILERNAAGRLRLSDGHSYPAGQKSQNELVRAMRHSHPASFLLYLAPQALSQWEELFSSGFRLGRLPFTAEILSGGGFFALSAQKNCLQLSARMTKDLYGARLFREALLPMIAGELLMGQEILSEAHLLRQQENREQCCAALRNYFPLLQKYAQNHHGAYPVPSGAAGLKLLFPGKTDPAGFCCPCGAKPKTLQTMEPREAPYLYFGGFKTSGNPDFPLLMDRPRHHMDYFNVLLADGRVMTIDLEDPDNVRRMIGALQSRFRYPEADLELLMKKAEKLESGRRSAPVDPDGDEEDEEYGEDED